MEWFMLVVSGREQPQKGGEGGEVTECWAKWREIVLCIASNHSCSGFYLRCMPVGLDLSFNNHSSSWVSTLISMPDMRLKTR